MYIKGCRAHFCHLPGLGQVGHTQGEPVGMLSPWTGAQCGWGSQATYHSQCPLTPIPALLMHPYIPCQSSDVLLMPPTILLVPNVLTPSTPCWPLEPPTPLPAPQCSLTTPTPFWPPEPLHPLLAS